MPALGIKLYFCLYVRNVSQLLQTTVNTGLKIFFSKLQERKTLTCKFSTPLKRIVLKMTFKGYIKVIISKVEKILN